MLTAAGIRKKMKKGQETIGSWLQIPSSDVAELMGKAGYDWLAVDMEHGSFSRENLADIFRAIELGGTVPFARVADNSMASIKSVLEAGARGVIFPMIENREQLDFAIDLSLYPPEGKRGVGYCRGNLFGKDFDQGLVNNRELLFCAQIEHINAMDHMDEILGHPRLDAIMIGPYDFTGSMDITGEFEHPDFISALESIKQKAAAQNIPMGLHVVQPDPVNLKQKISQGYKFIAYGTDALFLYGNAQCPE